MESRLFTITGLLDDEENTSLRVDLNPPIYLSSERQYMMGVIGFETFNNIPNVYEKNNIFAYRIETKDGTVAKNIEIPVGTYNAKDIHTYLTEHIEEEGALKIALNTNTMATHLKCRHEVDFTMPTSIAPLLGFEHTILGRNQWHISPNRVKIIGVNSLTIKSNVVGGSYSNGMESHILHQFFPSVPPGYKIIDRPQPVIYLPLITDTITELIIEIEDEQGRAVNFNGELVTLTLHLKSV